MLEVRAKRGRREVEAEGKGEDEAGGWSRRGRPGRDRRNPWARMRREAEGEGGTTGGRGREAGAGGGGRGQGQEGDGGRPKLEQEIEAKGGRPRQEWEVAVARVYASVDRVAVRVG